MKTNVLVLFIMMVVTFTLKSQITGVVVDKDSVPIPEVEIVLPENDINLYTNKSGEFSIDLELSIGSYIYFYKNGYESKKSQYAGNIELLIMLDDLHVKVDEISVAASYNILGNSKLTNIVNKNIKDVFLNSNSLLESVEELSGVDLISSGTGIQKVVVRGLSGMRVVTYLNGMQINNQQWANDHGIGFTELGLDKVELIKGSSALRYGSETMGGLLYFKDQPFVKTDKLDGFVGSKFNINSHSNSNQFGIKWNKKNLFLNLFGEYTLSSDYKLPNGQYLFNSRFNKNTIKFSVSHKKNNLQNTFRYQLNNELTGIPAHVCLGDPSQIPLTDLLSESFDFNTDFEIKTPYQDVTNNLLVYDMNYFLNNTKMNLYIGHFINNLKEYEKITSPAFDLILSNTLINPHVKYFLNNSTLEFGSQFSILNNKNNINERLVPDASSMNIGPYGTFNYETNNIGLNLGARFDYKTLKSKDNTVTTNMVFNVDYEKSFTHPSFSSGFYYKFKDHITRISYSGSYRAPHFSELFSNGVHHGTNRYELGDTSLSIEKANQIDFKYQWSNDHLGIVINPFIQNINNFISINLTDSIYISEDNFGNVLGSYRVYEYMQYESVELKGFEMNLHYHPHYLHNLHIEQSYSFLKTNNKEDSLGLALTPANSIKTRLLLDLSKYEKLNKFKINSISLYHKYKFEQNSIAQYEEATDSYNVFNLQIGGNVSDNLKYTFGIQNLFNSEYTPHISRIRGVGPNGVPNPGRSININLKYEF
ncbi:MAG: hypothetical protein CMD22_07535 [Flavobacteriales bacterium]|nr:hypothetical protein [Flavobacteriales bacterium]|tara:strand:+ start:5404 stop:7686 length:2283 start_codon:yes stop_codon:yes gene_type:complete